MFRPRVAPRLVRLPALCAILLSLALAGAATASPVQISYSVTGGTFGGPHSSGAITGGSLSFLAFTSNPDTAFAPARLTALTLNGPSGFFRLDGPFDAITGSALFTPNFLGLAGNRSLPLVRTGNQAGTAVFQAARLTASSGAGAGAVTGRFGSASALFSHAFQIGNEVRIATTPEPSTGLALGLGLGALGLAARTRRARRGR